MSRVEESVVLVIIYQQSLYLFSVLITLGKNLLKLKVGVFDRSVASDHIFGW